MRNFPEWIFSFMAGTMIGAVVVPMNGWWTTEEFDYGLEDCGAKVVIADEDRFRTIKPVQDRLGFKTIVARAKGDVAEATSYDSIRAGGLKDAPPAVEVDVDDDATIFYTSGSTGHPKGVVSTHRGILTTVISWSLTGAARAQQVEEEIAAGKREPSPASAVQQATLCSVPLFHVTGSHAIFLMCFPSARKLVLMYKWDAGEALRLIEEEKITTFTGVPTMSWEMMNHPDREKYDLSTLADLGGGGAARPPEQVKALAKTFKGKSPGSGYGLTETNALGAVNGGDNYLLKPSSTGRPTGPAIEIQCWDEAGNEVPVGQPGEVMIKSTSNFRAYWNKPNATDEAFTDGWFHTGDVGQFDEDGFLYIVDRLKDLVIRGGENISCIEVEAAIYEHPAVMECTVYGVPDERLGEQLAVTVMTKDGQTLDEAELQAHVAERLAKFKVPHYVWIQKDQLPRTATGKIFKRQLREEATERLKKAS